MALSGITSKGTNFLLSRRCVDGAPMMLMMTHLKMQVQTNHNCTVTSDPGLIGCVASARRNDDRRGIRMMDAHNTSTRDLLPWMENSAGSGAKPCVAGKSSFTACSPAAMDCMDLRYVFSAADKHREHLPKKSSAQMRSDGLSSS